MIGRNFKDLYQILKFDSSEHLEQRRARLFPNGKSKVEDETTTCSIFLATMIGIKEFREHILSQLDSEGSSRITNQTAELHAYVEVEDEHGRPDGLLVLTTGKRDKAIAWAAYIEVKTKSKLLPEQVERYMKRAKSDSVPAVITVSNDFVPYANINPTGIVNDKLFHWSWNWLLSELYQLRINETIKDDDQAYMASEFIKYLTNHNDVKDFSDMGPEWEPDAKLFVDGEKVKKGADPVLRTVYAWSREEKDIAIKLSACNLEDSGCHRAELCLTRDERRKEKKHFENLADSLLTSGEFISTYALQDLSSKVFSQNKTKKLEVKLKFRGRKLVVGLRVPAKENAKAQGQTTHLLRQLVDMGIEDEVKVIANFGRKQFGPATLKGLRCQSKRDEEFLIIPIEKKRESIRDFYLYYEMDMGREFYSRRKLIVKIETAILQFYREVAGRYIF